MSWFPRSNQLCSSGLLYDCASFDKFIPQHLSAFTVEIPIDMETTLLVVNLAAQAAIIVVGLYVTFRPPATHLHQWYLTLFFSLTAIGMVAAIGQQRLATAAQMRAEDVQARIEGLLEQTRTAVEEIRVAVANEPATPPGKTPPEVPASEPAPAAPSRPGESPLEEMSLNPGVALLDRDAESWRGHSLNERLRLDPGVRLETTVGSIQRLNPAVAALSRPLSNVGLYVAIPLEFEVQPQKAWTLQSINDHIATYSVRIPQINAGEAVNAPEAFHFKPTTAGVFGIAYGITAKELPRPVSGTFFVEVK